MTSPRVIYFGVSPQKSAAEVGGWSNVDKMGLKDALTYDTTTRRYHNYTKSQITDLINHLQTADLIVGFNQLQFDYKILSSYTDTDLEALPNFDMLSKIKETLNFRIPRDNLVQNTLNEFKNSKGQLTIENRVGITKKLFAHGCKEGYLFYYDNRFRTKAVCNTSSWADTARSLTQRQYYPEIPNIYADDPLAVATRVTPDMQEFPEVTTKQIEPNPSAKEPNNVNPINTHEFNPINDLPKIEHHPKIPSFRFPTNFEKAVEINRSPLPNRELYRDVEPTRESSSYSQPNYTSAGLRERHHFIGSQYIYDVKEDKWLPSNNKARPGHYRIRYTGGHVYEWQQW